MHIVYHVNTYEAVQAHDHDNISMQLRKGQMKASITSSFKCIHACVCVFVRVHVWMNVCECVCVICLHNAT